MRIAEEQALTEKENNGRPRSNQPQQLGGTSSIHIFYVLLTVGLVLATLLLTFVHRGYSFRCPPCPRSLSWVFLHSPSCSPYIRSLGHHPRADFRRGLLSCASSACHLTMELSAALRTPRYHVSVIVAAVDHNAVSTPNPKGQCSVECWVAWTSPRS